MRKGLIVFILTFFLLTPLLSATYIEKSTQSNKCTVNIGFENRSSASNTQKVTIPPNKAVSNTVQVDVRRKSGINFVVMQGETKTKKLNINLPSQTTRVELEKEGITKQRNIVDIKPRRPKIGPRSGSLNFTLNASDIDPGYYKDKIQLKDGERVVGDVKLRIEVLDEIIEEMDLQRNEIQSGGIFYKWYRTYPNSIVDVNSEMVEASKPDKRGLFNLKINSTEILSELNNTPPVTVNFSLGITVMKNEVVEEARKGIEFTLNITKRDRSTRWNLGTGEDKALGIGAFIGKGKHRNFGLEYDTRNELKTFNGRSRKVGGGFGTSLLSTQIGPLDAEVIGGSGSTYISKLSGHSEGIDYENCDQKGRAESGVRILQGIASNLKPSAAMILDEILGSPEYMDRRYVYTGTGIQTKGDINLIETSLKPGDTTSSNVLGLQVGGEGTYSGWYKYSKNKTGDAENYIFGNERSWNLGISGNVLGTELYRTGDGKKVKSRLVMENSSKNKVPGRFQLSSGKRTVTYSMDDMSETEIYRKINRSGANNYFVLATKSWIDGIEEAVKDGKKVNKEVTEKRGVDIETGVPIEVDVLGMKLSVAKNIDMSRKNSYTDSRYLIRRNKELILKDYPKTRREPTRRIDRILEYSLDPVLESSEKIDIMKKTVTDGKLTFPSGSLSSTDEDHEFLITTYDPSEYSKDTVKSEFLTSLSGTEFATGNVTQIDTKNKTDLNGNVTLESGGNSDKIYRWNTTEDVWEDVETTTSGGGSTVDLKEGTYVTGKDVSEPKIHGNISEEIKEDQELVVSITDNGTGVRESSIDVKIGGKTVNFSYSSATGELQIEQNVDPGSYDLNINASDGAGNTETFMNDIEVVESEGIGKVNTYLSDGNLILNWSYEPETDRFMILRNGVNIANVSQRSYKTEYTNYSFFSVFPVKNGSIEDGSSTVFDPPKIIPDFSWNWDEGMRPRTGNQIKFMSLTDIENLNRTIERKMQRWTFTHENGTVIGSRRGNTTTFTFPEQGNYSVNLNITDSLGKSSSIRKSLFVEENESKGTVNISIISETRDVKVKPGTILEYDITLRNMGNKHGKVNLNLMGCPWKWELVTGNGRGKSLRGRSIHLRDRQNMKLRIEVPENETSDTDLSFVAQPESGTEGGEELEFEVMIETEEVQEKSDDGSGSLTEQGPEKEEYNQTEINEDDTDETSTNSTDDDGEENETMEGNRTQTPTGKFTANGKTSYFVITVILISVVALLIRRYL